MAFKDGMNAISKVLKVLAIGGAALCTGFGISDGGHNIWIGLLLGAMCFALFWTPAWVIRKFIQ